LWPGFTSGINSKVLFFIETAILKQAMKILVIDDEKNIRKTVDVAFRSMGHNSKGVGTPESALDAIMSERYDAAFLDLKLGPGIDGLDILPQILERSPETHVVVFTAHASIETAVKAIQLGATDYLEKPFTPDQMRLALQRIEKVRSLHHRINELEDCLSESGELQSTIDFATESPIMEKIYATARKVATSEASVLILGESGTGKSVLAKAIHKYSSRNKNNFVTVSCPSLTKDLLASELFGHLRGAFTGAVRDRWGKIAKADKGTLFLDEIADMPLELQPNLLRLLQEKQYERVGDTVTQESNTRVISATNRSLDDAIVSGTFREDLYYRLNVITLCLPSLRDRREDIEMLAVQLLRLIAVKYNKPARALSPRAMSWVKQHDWPGNLRELRNSIERGVILSDGPTVELEALINHDVETITQDPLRIPQAGDHISLRELEEAHVQRIIELSSTMENAAKTLDINPTTLYRRKKKLVQKES
jgi:NtrC-family two-component system response regulator AlgB